MCWGGGGEGGRGGKEAYSAVKPVEVVWPALELLCRSFTQQVTESATGQGLSAMGELSMLLGKNKTM